MKKTEFCVLLISMLLLGACEIINPEEDIPAYLSIEPFQYTSTDGIQSVKITDGWVYVDREFIGAFDLPHTFPVLKSGSQEIFVDPGIKDNGVAATPDLYPFYKRYITTAELIPGETVTLQPATSYDEDTQFLFREFFEGNLHRLTDDLDDNPETKVEFETSIVKEGEKAGKILLDHDNSFILVGTNLIAGPLANGTIGFIEMDYKTDVHILMGMLGYDGVNETNFSQVDFGVNPSTDWNKIYFNVTELMNGLAVAGSQTYQIVFQAQIPTDNGEFTLENAEIYLDNIKLVSF